MMDPIPGPAYMCDGSCLRQDEENHLSLASMNRVRDPGRDKTPESGIVAFGLSRTREVFCVRQDGETDPCFPVLI